MKIIILKEKTLRNQKNLNETSVYTFIRGFYLRNDKKENF